MRRLLSSLLPVLLFVSIGGCDLFGGETSPDADERSERAEEQDSSEASEEPPPADRHLEERHGEDLGHHADDGDGPHHEIGDDHSSLE